MARSLNLDYNVAWKWIPAVLNLSATLFLGCEPSFKLPDSSTLQRNADTLTEAQAHAIIKQQVVDPSTPYYCLVDESRRKNSKMTPVFIQFWYGDEPRCVCLSVETVATTSAEEHLRACQRALRGYGLLESNCLGTVTDNCGAMTGKWNGFVSIWGEELNQVILHIGCGLHQSSLTFEKIFRAIGGPRPSGPPSEMWGPVTGCHIENVLVSLYETFAKEGKWEGTCTQLRAAGVANPQKFKKIVITRWGYVYDETCLPWGTRMCLWSAWRLRIWPHSMLPLMLQLLYSMKR